jgi:hypothetical protein
MALQYCCVETRDGLDYCRILYKHYIAISSFPREEWCRGLVVEALLIITTVLWCHLLCFDSSPTLWSHRERDMQSESLENMEEQRCPL